MADIKDYIKKLDELEKLNNPDIVVEKVLAIIDEFIISFSELNQRVLEEIKLQADAYIKIAETPGEIINYFKNSLQERYKGNIIGYQFLELYGKLIIVWHNVGKRQLIKRLDSQVNNKRKR
jgi:hypothetical protein